MVESIVPLEQPSNDLHEEPRHSGCGSCGTGKALASLIKCGNGLEKIYPTTAVRFGYMRFIGEFAHVPDMKFTCGAKVVIQTKRGLEIGDQVSLTCTGCDKSVTRDQMRAWVKSCGEDTYMFDAGRILREATAADLAEFARIQSSTREKRDFAQQAADRKRLALDIVDCEYLFGGERIIFYFTAAERVDFRDMVKDLAKEYRTRIEMRQIGARDEARLLADFETCGREVCCKVFLKTLRPITMRMAKLQKATLDPTQVSGRCGRLKCCLRYEHVGYEELDKKLPRTGIRIRTNHGEGVIVNRQVLTQLVQIRTDDDTLVTVVAEDITAVGVERSAPPPSTDDGVGRGPRRDRREGPRRPRPEGRRGAEGADGPRPLRDEVVPAEPPPPADQPSPEGDDAEAPRRRRRRRRRRPTGDAPGGAPGDAGPPPQ
jgi:cell fate regulator YaaT (PSP1 superfamily)